MLPFGLCNGPATFQRTMGTLLAGIKWGTSLVYLDDILVLSESFGDHLNHFRSVLQRLRESALKLNPRKCNLCSPSLKYLGHVVSSDGSSPNPAKFEAVKNIQAPTTKSGIRSFLGLASYYCSSRPNPEVGLQVEGPICHKSSGVPRHLRCPPF